MVVPQGSLNDRGGAGVVGKVWVRWVNQGWTVGYDLERNSSSLAHLRFDLTCMFDFELTWEYVGWLM